MPIKILKIDQTKNWSDEIQKKVKRIFGVFIFDSKKTVHCCELTPSFECTFIGSQVDFIPDTTDKEIDNIEDEILQGEFHEVETVSYFHCHTIDNAKRFKSGFLPKGNIGTLTITGLVSKDLEERLQEAIQYAHECGV